MSGSNGRLPTAQPIKLVSRDCSAGSQSRPPLSRAGSSARSAARRHGHWPSGTTPARSRREAPSVNPDKVPASARSRMTRRHAAVVSAALGTVAAVAAGAWVVGIGRQSALDSAAGPPRFVDETATAGLAQTYDGPLAFFVGGGVAVFDCHG